ncbi:uncharacterized protein GGS22DRAFT_172429 [Annulohypoxylon maeteangense]|uniref:uncharacterized protein n=1 Tax=Annulohypoxylon maeteangense TaxID=1927788 RepID=UPI002007236A|nr:uncharacterized protein GGS22DRAFT_172429 [Annulohypoxylon maeteangense]KAI0881534.1 hypothetical protein GGS22DRAFT_172429 [Annulohypoxylon maeteangense]
MESFQLGFYTITILAACKVILIALEIFFNIRKPKAIFLVVSGCVSAFLALVLGCVSFVGLRARVAEEPRQCENADADIVGDGVRAAAWTQVGILFFITFTGIFHFYKTAVKEIGGGLIVTHVSLAIALLVPLARHELSPIDAILGSLILDAQGNSLSIQLVTKETLAARWQVAIALISQLLGLLIEGTLVGFFTTNRLPTKSCNCFSVFWWTWFSNCSSVSPNHVEPYWIYFGYRFINILHGSYFAITRTTIYDDADKWDRENPCDPCDNCRTGEPSTLCKCHPCERCLYCKVCKRKARCHPHQPVAPTQNASHNAIVLLHMDTCTGCYRCKKCGHSNLDADTSVLLSGERFSEATMTVSSNFLENSVLALISMVSAEVTMSMNMVQKTSPLYAVGQVTSLVIAVGTTVRALWVFLYMFDSKSHSAYVK